MNFVFDQTFDGPIKGILQNIFFCVEQKKKIHTGSEHLEVDK